MSAIENIVKSRGFKQFMAKLYGWGAALVILGALFKILHYPGADTMLLVGMGTEAVIFFFSAFEPPHVEPDWSLVYPELAGMYHGDESFDDLSGGVEEEAASLTNDPLSQKLDELLKEANIGPELFKSLEKGLTKMSENASHMGELSSTVTASESFTTNMKVASDHISDLSESYKKSAEVVKKTADSLDLGDIDGASYGKELKRVTGSMQQLGEAYDQQLDHTKTQIEASGKLQASMTNLFTSVDGVPYGDELKSVTDKMQQLGHMYELQLQTAQSQVDSSEKLQKAMTTFFKNMEATADQTLQYKAQSEILTRNVEELNKVYGNMLSAMTIRQA